MNDLSKKKKAIEEFTRFFGGSYELLAPSDVYCRVFDADKKPLAYIDIVLENKQMTDAYPLVVPARRILKLADKRLNPTMIWMFVDGIVYCKIKKISGEIVFGKINDNSPDELLIKIAKRQRFLRFTSLST
jgi:hypothetical protein